MSKFSNLQSKLPDWIKTDVFLGIVTILLWVISGVLSFAVMTAVQYVLLRYFSIVNPDSRWVFQVFRQWSTIFLVAAWIGFVVITGEYHYQHQRSPSSWNLFKWSFISLVVIGGLALIL